MFKTVIAALAVVLGCAACAGGASSSGAGSGSITMYGTVDEGISYHSK